MAASMMRLLMPFQRPMIFKVQCVETLLDPTGYCRLPTVTPLRTKKRYFIPKMQDTKTQSKAEQEAQARSAGLVVQQEYMERAINIACTAGIFDPYIPPEGDARLSKLSKEGLKQRTEQLRQSAASQLAIRKIKEHDPQFNTKDFPNTALNIFIEAHSALTQFNKEKLHKLVTERCYPEMVRGNRYKTLRWSFVESLEPPRVVHARCPDMVSKGNLYGQVTLRLHSRQTVAIYDRFGRLMLGNEDEPRDVLEYVVLERHLINSYGCWRLHGKIIPAWAPPKEPVIKTVMIPGPQLKPWEEFESLCYEVPKPRSVQWHQ
ncbi:39S ribosomal protein L45, mitochondrial [Brienomyrus brachyistius]|uniref:39S ribosomal protein L45, mitochondrial n=1 Tax=Brienomyrus brachyistius TaxID=42636 RepID=UPI0020B26D0C|nr:39S ribosomal protein L45, mitochondrial [Brienomyrus brachyistius]